MYDCRKLSPVEKRAVVAHRRERGLPLHAPPHYPDGRRTYILTSACYEHRPLMSLETRRGTLQDELLRAPAELHAWVILPNHYHLLLTTDLAVFREWIRLLHSRLATVWNREDQAKGRQVWYRFQDRLIRGENHYFATLNYIHANPVRHGFVRSAGDWTTSSFPFYLAKHGREALAQLWKTYPVADYGKGWDEEPGRHSAALRG